MLLRERAHEQRVELGRVELVRERAREGDAIGRGWGRACAAVEGVPDGFGEACGGAGEVEGFEGGEGVEDEDGFGAGAVGID